VTLFFCAKQLRKAASNSAHRVIDQCLNVKLVLGQHPEFGEPIPGTSGLRKMRVRVLDIGKRGGYRLIYSKHESENGVRIALHDLYFKGDIADLPVATYKAISDVADAIDADVETIQWDN